MNMYIHVHLFWRHTLPYQSCTRTSEVKPVSCACRCKNWRSHWTLSDDGYVHSALLCEMRKTFGTTLVFDCFYRRCCVSWPWALVSLTTSARCVPYKNRVLRTCCSQTNHVLLVHWSCAAHRLITCYSCTGHVLLTHCLRYVLIVQRRANRNKELMKTCTLT